MNILKTSINPLQDQYGREMKKLRVSLIDACNFRCTYCMPESAMFAKDHDLLSPLEIKAIVKELVQYGIEEVRLTGGEPTLRHDLVSIANELSDIGLKKLSMTTNASQLDKFLYPLRETSLSHLNISLDSLDPLRFKQITKKDNFKIVLDSILKAKDLGFSVKINTVIMKNYNLNEIEQFIEFSKKNDIEVRFLELIKIGVAIDFFDEEFIPASNIIFDLRKKYKLKPVEVEKDSTSFKFLIDEKIKIGFIASESMAFCQNCSRLRLDSKGRLRACLMKEESVDLRNNSVLAYPRLLEEIIAMKPYERIEKLSQPMYQIGG